MRQSRARGASFARQTGRPGRSGSADRRTRDLPERRAGAVDHGRGRPRKETRLDSTRVRADQASVGNLSARGAQTNRGQRDDHGRDRGGCPRPDAPIVRPGTGRLRQLRQRDLGGRLGAIGSPALRHRPVDRGGSMRLAVRGAVQPARPEQRRARIRAEPFYHPASDQRGPAQQHARPSAVRQDPARRQGDRARAAKRTGPVPGGAELRRSRGPWRSWPSGFRRRAATGRASSRRASSCCRGCATRWEPRAIGRLRPRPER